MSWEMIKACRTGLNTISKLDILLPCTDSKLTLLPIPSLQTELPPPCLCAACTIGPQWRKWEASSRTQSMSSLWHSWSPFWHPGIRKCGPHQTGPKFLNVWERKGQALYTGTWGPWSQMPLLIPSSYSNPSPWHTGICIISIFKKVQCWLSDFVVFTGVKK